MERRSTSLNPEQALQHFRIPNGSVFSHPDFQYTNDLHSYLHQDLEKQEIGIKQVLEMLCAIIDTSSELRYMAEEHYPPFQHLVNDKKRELPLDWSDIIDYLTAQKQDIAPARLITAIAQQKRNLIEKLFLHLNTVLRRERQMTPLSRAQQIDNSCLRWLSRQAGHTALEKSGPQQRILSLVRQESYNTLENRVLKDFLRRCTILSRQYLRQYQQKFPDCERVQSVHQLCTRFQAVLRGEQLQQVEKIRSLPTPNYALMYNPSYSMVWDFYKKILAQLQLVEQAWAHRHTLCFEAVQLYLHSMLRLDATQYFSSQVWTNASIENGQLLNHTRFANVYLIHGSIVEISYPPQDKHSISIKIKGQQISFDFYYIPLNQFPTLCRERLEERHRIIIHEDSSCPIRVLNQQSHSFATESETCDKIAQLIFHVILQQLPAAS
ncbi:MAG: DUF2357 domain-containing protein [Akkermansia sp.]